MRIRALALPLALLLAAGGILGARPSRAASEISPYGINIHAPQGDALRFSLDKVQAAGIGWVRIDFIWAAVQPQAGVWDWSIYDRLAAEAKARGLQVFATIAYTPEWASQGPAISGVPDDPATWREFCTQAAARYRGSIRYWGVWNEPNLSRFWAGSKRQYLDIILKPGIAALRAGNPDAKVGGPELAGIGDWYYWLQDALDEAGGQLDFITHHVYDADGNRDVTKTLEGSTSFGNHPSLWDVITPSVREVLKEAGRRDKPFWLTETGWRSDGPFEIKQASYLEGLLSDWYTGRPNRDWVTRTFFYELQDSAERPDLTWGLLRADGSEKSAFIAYREFITARSLGNDDAAVVAEGFPTRLEAGQPLTVRVTMRNTGTSTWSNALGYSLAAQGDVDPFTEARQLFGPTETVAPGQSKTFALEISAPTSPGSYTTGWQMLKDGVGRFGQSFQRTMTVAAAPPAAERRLDLFSTRFRVEVSWRNNAGQAGWAHALSGTDQTGYFWFFDPGNVELVVKALDGRPVNDRYWFFYGALSDVEYWVKVTDRVTGAVRTYHNPAGNLCGQGDTAAFRPQAVDFAALSPSLKVGGAPLPPPAEVAALSLPPLKSSLMAALAPAAPAASCAPGPDALCLLGGRFRVQAEWRTRDGVRGNGSSVPTTDQSGKFWFFDPQNVELVVKVLDGRPVNGKFWFFYGALSDVEYRITVTDLATGTVKQYYNPPGNLCGKGDTAAL